MGKRELRRTAIGLLVGAVVFAGLALYMNAVTGVGLLSNPGPVAVMSVIGGTVGGLAAPLVGGLLDRIRDRDDR